MQYIGSGIFLPDRTMEIKFKLKLWWGCPISIPSMVASNHGDIQSRQNKTKRTSADAWTRNYGWTGAVRGVIQVTRKKWELQTCSDALGGSETLAGIPIEHVEEGAHTASHSWRLRASMLEGRRPSVGLGQLIHHSHVAQRNDALPVECQVLKRLPGEAGPPQDPRSDTQWWQRFGALLVSGLNRDNNFGKTTWSSSSCLMFR